MKRLLLFTSIAGNIACFGAARVELRLPTAESLVTRIQGKEHLPYQLALSQKKEVFHLVLIADPHIDGKSNDIATKIACGICCEDVFAECFDRKVKDIYPTSPSSASCISKPRIAALLRISPMTTYLQYQDQTLNEEGTALLNASVLVALKRVGESSVQSIIVEQSEIGACVVKQDFDIAFIIERDAELTCKKILHNKIMQKFDKKKSNSSCALQ
jgi:hypothetical protein